MRTSKDIVVVSIAFASILAISLGFMVKSIFFSSKDEISGETGLTTQESLMKKYPSLPAEALRLKLSKNDPLEILDLRPQPLYTEEHIPQSKHLTIADLGTYAPKNENAEVIIITLSDDAVSMEQIHTIFSGKNFAYAFLEGGLASWKALSGNLVSVGNPNSVIDRAKVSFKTAEEVKATIESVASTTHAILDVRPTSAYANGHIPTAINIPLGELEQRRTDIPSGRQIIAYGSTDLESFQAAVRLYDLNVFAPYAIENGFPAWTDKKYEVVK